MSYIMLTGAALGFAAGISPGPLLTLVISESLRGGWPAGFRVALAPLVTDSVLIVSALLVIAPMPGWGLALISLVGGGVLVWMGWGTVRGSTLPVAAEDTAPAGRSPLVRGVLTNLLNPHAILFWITNGGPLLKESLAASGWLGPALFLAPFFVLLIGSKMVVALAVASGRRFLQGAAYRFTLAVSGALLALLGLWRIWDGVQALL